MSDPKAVPPHSPVLPPELMELQLGQIDLLMAMYPSEGEVVVEEGTRALISALREWCNGDGDGETPTGPPPRTPADLSFVLNLDVSAPPRAPGHHLLQLEIALPLRCGGGGAGGGGPDEPPVPRVRVCQPDWLSRAETARLAAEAMPGVEDGGAGDLLGAIEAIKDLAGRSSSSSNSHGDSSGTVNGSGEQQQQQGEEDGESTVRAWFYFPSISTRAKRDDLVAHAPAYGLTGFLLAGKPGVLCVEGAPARVDRYMRFIRTESWGDIPAHHKKVSERYREAIGAGGGGRAFADMREITDELAAFRRGERANRNDMKALEAWLAERGLGDAFAKVLI